MRFSIRCRQLATGLGVLLSTAPPAGAVCPDFVIPGHGQALDLPSFEVESTEGFAWLGYAVRTAGDVNGDGFSDLAVGSPLDDGTFLNEGRVELYLGDSGGGSTTPDWFAQGSNLNALLGTSVSTAGDVNGDGFDDLIVGEPGYANGQADEGRALIYHGSALGLSSTPDWEVEIDLPMAQFGASVSTAGDVNGDGYDDVIVGAPGLGETGTLFEQQGAAYVYLGSPSGVSLSFQAGVVGGQAGARLGMSVCTAGDVNADGYDDVIVGAPFAENIAGGGQGQARIYLGSGTGVSTTANWDDYGSMQSSYGASVSTAGDVDGDGFGDVLVGAKDHEEGGVVVGALHLYLGSSTGPSASPDLTIFGCEANAEFGASVFTAGDTNGDGMADVVVGAPLHDRSPQLDNGALYLYLGHPTQGLDATPAIYTLGLTAGGKLGKSVGSAGDMNGDGFGDLVVGAPEDGTGQNQQGVVRVYPGRGLPAADDHALMVTGGQQETNMGYDARPAGDLNGDGFDDFAVDLSRYDQNGADRGRVHVYFGTENGPSPGIQILEGESAGDLFGSSVGGAGDVNGDGYDDLLVGAPRYSVGALERGRVYCYYGSVSGLNTTPAWTAEGEAAETNLFVVASAGDVDGDGFGDVLVAALGWDGAQDDQGKAWLYLGSSQGLESTPIWSFEGAGLASFLGYVSSAGDVNGDGYSDILVGVGNDGAVVGEGIARMFLGGPNGPSTTHDWEVTGGQLGAHLEPVESAGDVNGDGYADVIASARYYSNSLGGTGIAWVFHGSASGLSITPSATLETFQMNAEFGRSVGSAGDVNGDGYSDVLVGATSYAPVEVDEGGFFLYFGSASGIVSQAVHVVRGGAPDTFLGRSVASAGDVDGDGFSDILIGATGFDGFQQNEGAFYLYLGNLKHAVPRLVAAPQQSNDDGPIPLLGVGTSPIELSLRGHSAAGRTDLRLEWSVQPLGSPHPEVGTLEPWIDTGPVEPTLGSYLNLTKTVTLAQDDTPYTWRVRTRADSPFFPRSPWMTKSSSVPSLTQLRSAASGTPVSPHPRVRGVVLRSVAPNPFNPRTSIVYSVPQAGHVRLTVSDLRGRHVKTLVDAVRPAGESSVVWSGRDARGRRVGSGVYLLRLQSAAGSDQRKLSLLQ